MGNKNGFTFSPDQLDKIKTSEDVRAHLANHGALLHKIEAFLDYKDDLQMLQIELLKLQTWIHQQGKRAVVVCEGRDAAGKGGAIRRFIRYLNPRSMRVVALNKPTDIERGQWYFRRHVKELPNPGEIRIL